MKKIKKYFKLIIILLIIILVIGYIIIKLYLNKNDSVEVVLDEFDLEFNENINVKEDVTFDSNKIFYVDIKGAVQNPGVYEIEENKKVIDQTCSIMIQRLRTIFQRNPLISMGI